MAVEAADADSASGQLFLELAIERDRLRFIAAIPGDQIDSGSRCDAEDQFGRVPLHQDETAALPRQGFAERVERTRQPPARGASQRPTIGAGVENIEAQDGPGFRRRGEGGIIRQPQIVPEPVQGAFSHCSSTVRRDAASVASHAGRTRQGADRYQQ